MRTVIGESLRVLKPGGRFFATLMTPDYWVLRQGYADWVNDEVIEINQKHVEKARVGARYFVFRDEAHIRDYFSGFSDVWIGSEHRVFGDRPEKYISHWLVSARK